MKVFWALNRATSRRSGQRRDVPERKFSNVATFQRIVISNVATLDINVATFQKGEKINVATLDINVTTFQRMVKIDVVTLDINVATF